MGGDTKNSRDLDNLKLPHLQKLQIHRVDRQWGPLQTLLKNGGTAGIGDAGVHIFPVGADARRAGISQPLIGGQHAGGSRATAHQAGILLFLGKAQPDGFAR